MNIGNNINYLRFKKSVTQNELAEYLGVTYQAVSKWENEANLPDISLIPQIANFFGVSIDTLFSENISDEEIFEDIADDDVIRVVQMRGKKRIKVDRTFSPNCPPIEIAFPRNCNNETQYFKVEIFGHVIADGSINGDVIFHRSIKCGEINCDTLQTEGDIHAHVINSSGSVDCKDIIEANKITAKNINCAGNITCNKIETEN